jgi:methylmalonic aciduria homocystinuria type C protein
LEKKFNGISIDLINDYDMTPGTRRAKIVMQTCAHISGAAYFYDKKLIASFPNETEEIKNKVKFMF